MKFKLNESNIPPAREVVDEHFSWAQEELGDASPEDYIQFFKDIASEAGMELNEDDLIDVVLDYFDGNVTEPLPEDLEEVTMDSFEELKKYLYDKGFEFIKRISYLYYFELKMDSGLTIEVICNKKYPDCNTLTIRAYGISTLFSKIYNRESIKGKIEEILNERARMQSELKEFLKEASSGTTVYRAEYYEPKLGKWISYYENNSLDAVKSNFDTPIVGDPKKRIAQYEKSGVRKPSYKLVKEVDATLEEAVKYYPQDYDTIEINYDDLEIVDNKGDEITIDYSYEVDKDDVYTFIFESCIDEEDYPRAFEDGFDANNEEDWNQFVSWLEDNFDEIFTKYEDQILDNYRKSAAEKAEENYDPDDYIDWDSMPGGHDDYDLDEALNDSEPRYTPKRYGMYWWGIIDHTLNNGSGLMMRIGENPDYSAPLDNNENKLLLFKSKELAQEKCDALNSNINEEASMKFKVMNEDYEPGRYADRIFDLLDQMSGDQIHACLIESEYDTVLGTTVEMSAREVYDKVDDFLDKDSGAGLYKQLDRYCYWNRICESKQDKICCICKQPYEGYGNNAEPVCSGTCCDKCNIERVIPMRFKMMKNDEMITEAQEREFTIFTNDEVYCDEDGNPYYFYTYQDAEDFIIENDLDNAEVVRQAGKAKYDESLNEARTSKPDRAYVDGFLKNLEIPSRYYKVVSGPKNLYWNSVGEDEYYITVSGSLGRDVNYKDIYSNLVNLFMFDKDPEFKQELMNEYHIRTYTDDTMGLGMRYDNGNFGFIIKKAVASSKNNSDESLTEALTDYKITYYLATATKERRPETREDIDNDYKEIHVDANDDFDALSKAFMIQRQIDDSDLAFELDDFDIKNEDDFVRYFNDRDWSDGSILMLKVEGPNGVLYDTGYNKQTFIDELEDNIAQDKAMLVDMEKEDPEMAARFRELLGIKNESLEPVCAYEDCYEEFLTEDSESDTKGAIMKILDIINRDDDKKWASTVKEIVDAVPEKDVRNIVDTIKDKFANTSISSKDAQRIADAAGSDADVSKTSRLGEFVDKLDLSKMTEENPEAAKSILIAILIIVGIIEPTPIVEILAIIVAKLPENVIAKILSFLNKLTPSGAIIELIKKIRDKKNISSDDMEESFLGALAASAIGSYVGKKLSEDTDYDDDYNFDDMITEEKEINRFRHMYGVED